MVAIPPRKAGISREKVVVTRHRALVELLKQLLQSRLEKQAFQVSSVFNN